jgi:hypothetical protein
MKVNKKSYKDATLNIYCDFSSKEVETHSS